MEKYDIFISYKRIGASKAVAYRIYSALKNKGYKVFYDREEMFAGKFNEQLYANIDNAKDMIIILEEGSLKACHDKINDKSYLGDYFCKEIMHALKRQDSLRIIPMLIDGYKMPNDLPKELEGLSVIQAIEYDSGIDFESIYERYFVGKKKFLTSEPATKKEKGISDFLFYTNDNCSIWEQGNPILQLESNDNEDHPQRYSVMRSGEHRFTCHNYDTGETIRITETIEPNAQKYIELKWTLTKNVWLIDQDDIKEQKDNDILFSWGKTLFKGNKKHVKNIHMSLMCFKELTKRGDEKGGNFIKDNYKNTYSNSDYIEEEAFEWFSVAEELGVANASTLIGYCYAEGTAGKMKDINNAIEYYKKAAHKGDSYACKLLYHIYNNENNALHDADEAQEWLEKAANLGDSYALFKKGLLMLNTGEYELAFQLFDRGAELEDAAAICNLAYCYVNGLGTSADFHKAYELYRQCPDDSLAQYWIGRFYEEGEVVEQDWEKAIMWYEKSASQNDINGLFALGWMYRVGKGVKIDYPRAIDLFNKAIEQGSTNARVELADMYARGRGVDVDYATALGMFEVAAKEEEENPEAYHGIGYCTFKMGRYDESFRAYQTALDLGSEYVYDEIGKCYELGLGVKKDEEKAVELYKKGVDKQFVEAQVYLAECYEYGRGVEKNIDAAIELYKTAKENRGWDTVEQEIRDITISAHKRLGIELQ